MNTKFSRKLPQDISFLIADLKWNNGTLKILELGEGPQSHFQGFDELFETGIIWKQFWNHLAEYNQPLWYIGNKPKTGQQKQYAWDTFTSHNGTWAQSLQDVQSDTPGIITFSNHGYTNWYAADLAHFKKKNPHFLIINDIATSYVNNKYQTSLLFDDDVLRSYRPRWQLCKKNCCLQCIEKTCNYLNCNHIVIKPLNAANGWGTIMVDTKELATALQIIGTNAHQLKNDKSRAWNYWSEDKNEHIILEEFVTSHPTNVDGKKYDGTMRVVCILTYSNNTVAATYLGSCWKLPQYSLDEPGNLMEHHKSGYGATHVAAQDTCDVKKKLDIVLPLLYKKMLQHSLLRHKNNM